MTVGSYSRDSRIYNLMTGNTYAGSMVGSYSSKSWSGTDRGGVNRQQLEQRHTVKFHTILDPALRNQESLLDRNIKKPPPSPEDAFFARAKTSQAAREFAAVAYYRRHETNADAKQARLDAKKKRPKLPSSQKGQYKKFVFSPPMKAKNGKPLRPLTFTVPKGKRKPDRPNDYTMSALTHYNPVMGDCVNDRGPFGILRYYNAAFDNLIGIALPPDAPFNSNDDIKLVNRLSEKVRGSDFNLSVFLGESKQMLDMVGSSALRISQAFEHAKKRDFEAAANVLARGYAHDSKARKRLVSFRPLKGGRGDTVASNWLELQYGWIPLLSDAKSAAEQLAHRLEVPFRTRVVSSVTASLPGSYWDEQNLSFKWTAGRSLSQKRIIAYFEESQQETIPQLSGLLDPELVLWERLPYSFVADWFAPIGGYLQARGFARRLTGTFITTTKKEKYLGGCVMKKPFIGTYQGSPVYATYDYNCGGYYKREVSLTRVVSTSLSVPDLPQVKPLAKIASWQHCANALALLTVAFSRGKI